MSLLAPLYFAGALAIALPIVFHLIRRRPKSEVKFSSLMFLSPTPPRLTRRSRLDHLPLLLLRALALLLMAAAFSRPYFRSVSQTDPLVPPRRLVILLDTSASMQRAGLWPQAIAQARELINDLRVDDRIALVTFDRKPSLRLTLDETARLPVEGRRQAFASALSQVKPTWFATDLATALTFAADIAVEDDESELPTDGSPTEAEETDAVDRTRVGDTTLVLISDMQSGSQIEALQAFAWPERVLVDVRRVKSPRTTNATASILNPSTIDVADIKDSDKVRVRVSNTADATGSDFQVRWVTNDDMPAAAENAGVVQDGRRVAVQVPAGQSRVVRISAPPTDATALLLSGDDHDFDNRRFVAIAPPQEQILAFIGPDAADPRSSLFYYLDRAPLSVSTRNVTARRMTAEELASELDPDRTPLLVVAESLGTEAVTGVKRYLDRGGRVLVVLGSAETSIGLAETIAAITGDPFKVSEADVADYHMLSRIDFQHPLFRPMSEPQFNDFSKIRFWAHRLLVGLSDAWRIAASFDDGSPAIIDRPIGEGRITVLPVGWQPDESQLALSTKFIPMISGWFGADQDIDSNSSWTLGEPLLIDPSPSATLTLPDGSSVDFNSVDDSDAIDRPGIYLWKDGQNSRRFAINISGDESRTEPLDQESLQQFGVRLGREMNVAEAEATERQLRDRELESRQQLWRWMLVVALVFLGFETWWGARLSRSPVVTT